MANADHRYPPEDGGGMKKYIACKALPVYECAMLFGGRDGFQRANRTLWMLVLTATKLKILPQGE